LLALLLHAPGLQARLAGQLLQLAVAAVDERFDGSLVVLGKLPMLVTLAALALHGAGRVGPPAQAQPDRALVGGIAQGVIAHHLAQQVQLPGSLHAVGAVLAHLPGAAPPDGAVLKPDLLDDKVHALGQVPVLRSDEHLKGAAGLAVQPLHTHHLARVLGAVCVKAQKGRLQGDNGLVGQVEHVQADHRVGLGGQFEMPQLNRAAQVNLHGNSLHRRAGAPPGGSPYR
jgi:hypothetical protein